MRDKETIKGEEERDSLKLNFIPCLSLNVLEYLVSAHWMLFAHRASSMNSTTPSTPGAHASQLSVDTVALQLSPSSHRLADKSSPRSSLTC